MGADVRHLSHELYPRVLKEAGLPTALSSYCEEFSRTRSIPVSCEADSDIKELSPGTALALYRIAQEALGNTAKHAKAKQVRVRLTRAGELVRLTVSDDGVGFVPNRAHESGGVGLLNMRERARYLSGAFELESKPGHGTTVRAEIPFRTA
jgi:signal transduction histidine kinase